MSDSRINWQLSYERAAEEVERLRAAIATQGAEIDRLCKMLLKAKDRNAGLVAALKDMMMLHGKPHPEEWLNTAAFEHALEVHERAHAKVDQSHE